ncbi:MAG: hypothetical protein ACTHMK_16530 [Dyella sp.]|uniref:hypothetical protein n=1 Tax=Dyella sp. TaxID=1869338 RepID=UPI003F8150B8
MKSFSRSVAVFYSLSFTLFFWALLFLQFVQVIFSGRGFVFDGAAMRAVRGSIAAPLIFTFVFILVNITRRDKNKI